MNTTIESNHPLNQKFNEVSYMFVVPVVIVLVITLVALGSYIYKALTSSIPARQIYLFAHPQDIVSVAVEIGIDETTIQSYPTLRYSKATLDNKETTSCCSICLSDYKNSDILRLLPECGHLFHFGCIDPWLRMHPTCPVCRHSPIPTPLSTPM
ncbi:RING-type E3 ubiquitin transferase [Ranunculus cassubicifolius]